MQPIAKMAVTNSNAAAQQENNMVIKGGSHHHLETTLTSARNSSSATYNFSIASGSRVGGIRSNFPPSSKKLFTELNRGRIDMAFVQPCQFKYGTKFENKSEESRYTKKFDEIIKLRHILLTDSDKAKTFTKKVL